MTKLYASSAGSSQALACAPGQEDSVIEPYDRLVREIRNQLDEFPLGETVLVGNCPPDISEEEINNFFHGFATAVRLKKVSSKALTTTLFIAKFDSAESASRSKVLHTLSLKTKKIMLLQLEDRHLFGKNYVVELNGFQEHPEEVIYDHMSTFGQVNFILKTKSAAYIVFEEASSVEASSRCEYLDQYPVTIRSVLDTSIGSTGSAGIESCILEQIDQHSSLLVEEDEGQINNFMQLLDMDGHTLDEYMEMNERERDKSSLVDKPLLEVGNEEIIANESEDDDTNTADVAAIEKQAFQKLSDHKQKQPVEYGCILVDDRSALRLQLDGNLLRLSDLPQLRVQVQKIVDRKKTDQSTTQQEQHSSADLKSENRPSVDKDKQPTKEKSKKDRSDSACKVKSEKSKSSDGSKSKKHRGSSPARKSSKDKSKKQSTKSEQRSDVVIKVQPDPELENPKSNDESPELCTKLSPHKKSSIDKAEKECAEIVSDTSDETVPQHHDEETVGIVEKQPSPVKDTVDKASAALQSITSDRKKINPVVVLKKLTGKQLAELSIVRRESTIAVDSMVEREPQKQPKQDKSEKKNREKEKRKKSKHSHDTESKKRKIDDEKIVNEPVKTPDPEVVESSKPDSVLKEDEIHVDETSLEVELPVVVEESITAQIDQKADCSSTLLSDDEEERLVIDLPVEQKPEMEKTMEEIQPEEVKAMPVEAKLEIEKPTKEIQPEQVKPKFDRVVVKLDKQSAAILHDKVHDTYLLHLDVLSRVLIKLNRISLAGYNLPKPAKLKAKTHDEPTPRKSASEPKKREEKPVEKARKTDLEKIDNKFLPVGSKLKSQAKAKSKHESSHKKQHHVPVPELPIELKSHLNTSFKIPKKNSHSQKANSIKHSRSELDNLHRADEERERQRKRFQKEERPRERVKKPPPVEQRSNTPDYFDPAWDDDGIAGADDVSAAAEPEPKPREQQPVDNNRMVKNPFAASNNDREKEKKAPSFRDIWNLPPEKPQVWEKDPWASNATQVNNTIDSGEMWGSERSQQAVPVLPLFAREPSNIQRNDAIDCGDHWSPDGSHNYGRPSLQNFADNRIPDNTVKQGNTIDSRESWSPGRIRPNTSVERRPDKTTIADGESWSPEADTKKKIVALNVEQRRPPSRQDEPRKQPRKIESPAPSRRGNDTIASGDMWDMELPVILPGPTWKHDIKPDLSKENLVPDFLSDPVIRGASNDRSEKGLSNDRFRGGRRSPGTDERGRRRSRERSPEMGERGRRRSRDRSPRLDERGRQRSRDRSHEIDERGRRRSRDRSPGAFNVGMEERGRRRSRDRSPIDRKRRRSPNWSPARGRSPDRMPWEKDRERNRDRDCRSPPRRVSPDRRHRELKGNSPRRGLSPDRRRFSRDGSPMRRRRSRSRTPEFVRSRSPERRRPWSPFGEGAGRRRSRSRSPLRRMMGRSPSPEQPRQSPVRRGAARFRSRSRSRDRYDERKRSRSPPPALHRRESSFECSRAESWGRPREREEHVDRNVFSSPPRWAGQAKERQRSESNEPSSRPTIPNDDEIPYSPSNLLDGEDAPSPLPRELPETIPLQLPMITKASPRKQPEMTLPAHSATEEQPASDDPVSKTTQSQIRVKQEQLLLPPESTSVEEEPVAVTVEKPVNVKTENRSIENLAELRPPSSAKIVELEPQEEHGTERLTALGHLKQRAERLKKLEEMKLARQKLLAQIKLQNEKDKQQNVAAIIAVPQIAEQKEPEQPQPQVQPEPVVRSVVKAEPQCDRVPTPVVTDIKREPGQVDPSAASLLLETAVSILSTFGHLLPSIAGNAAGVPPLSTTPLPPPPLPVETPKPPPPDEPAPEMPSFPLLAPPHWEPPNFPPLPPLVPPPPMNPPFSMPVIPPIQPPAFPEHLHQQQQHFQDYSMPAQGDIDNAECYPENNYDEPSGNWPGPQGPLNFDQRYPDQPQNFDYDAEPNWQRRTPQEPPQNFTEESDWQQDQGPQLLPPEEFRAHNNGPGQQFNVFGGGNQRNRDPRQRFRGNNRGHNNNNNNAFRDPRRNRGGSIYAGGGGGGGFPQQQQSQQQQWGRNNNSNANRGRGGGQFGNQFRNNQGRGNGRKQGNQRRGGFKNFQQRPHQQQQGDDFFMDGGGGGDGSNWDGFM